MKTKVGKIVWITLLLLLIMQNACFADVVWQDPETGEWVQRWNFTNDGRRK